MSLFISRSFEKLFFAILLSLTKDRIQESGNKLIFSKKKRERERSRFKTGYCDGI